MRYVDIVFDGSPGPEGPRFVEAELDGRSIKIGEWVKMPERDYGPGGVLQYWSLRVKMPVMPSMLLASASAVDHPSHYNVHPSGVEAIDIMEHMTGNVALVIKHVWRAGLKVGSDYKASGDAGVLDAHIQDLEKARWYLSREIERLSEMRGRP